MNNTLITNQIFREAVFKEDAPFVHVTDFAWDPNDIPAEEHLRAWRGDWASRYTLRQGTNQYFCISIFNPDEKGIARRRKALFLRTHCIVLDDVREKLDPDQAARLPPPSWILETSPGSEQWGYILTEPCHDRARVENLLDGLVASDLAPSGNDPGMKGVTRYVRLPEGVNTKASKRVEGKPWQCRILTWEPERTTTLEALAAPFQINLDASRRDGRMDGAANVPDHPILEIPDIIHIKEVRSAGRFDITCPWVDEHTGAIDNGTGIFTNDDGSLGFKCHHGACEGRTARDLIRWVETQVPGWGDRFSLWKGRRQFSNLAADHLDFMGSSESKSQLSSAFDFQIALGFPDKKASGHPKATLENLRYLMTTYGVTAAYDVIAKKEIISIPGAKGVRDNADNSSVTEIISLACRYSMPSGNIPAFVSRIADENPINPVKDWIYSKPWDGVDRLQEFFDTLTPAPGYPMSLMQLLLRKWMISAVAAVLSNDKFHSRGVLTLQGPQGIGKTEWIRNLVGRDNERAAWVKIDHLLDPANKDSIISAISHWLVEIGELDATFRKADIAKLKGLITNHEDKVRRPYDRRESVYPRRTVFLATVNESNFLVDSTGNTRFWTIALSAIRYDHDIDMQQVWRQVAGLYEMKETWWLNKAEEAQLEAVNKSHRATSSVRDLILGHMDESATPRSMSAGDVLRCLGISNPTNSQCREAGAVLREHFGEPTSAKGYNKWEVTLRNHQYVHSFF